MAEDHEAPAGTGAPQEDSGEGSNERSTGDAQACGGVVGSEVEAAFGVCDGLLVRITQCRGDLEAAGAFERQSIRAMAACFTDDPEYADRFKAKMRDARVASGSLGELVAAVERIQYGRGVRLMSAEEVIASEPPAYLIDQIIEHQSQIVVFGPSGVGKTFVALDMAASIASGVDCMGHAVMQGPVVYVAAEGIGGLNKRLSAWKTARDVGLLPDLHFVPGAVNLLDELLVAELIEVATEVKPILMVFDTHARSMVGGDENSAKDTGMVISQLDRIRRATGAATLSIHHTDKKGSTERGSGALRGAVDTMIEVDRTKIGLFLTCDKQRNFEGFTPIAFHLESVGDSLVPLNGMGSMSGHQDVHAHYRPLIEEELAKANAAGCTPMSQRDVLSQVAGNAQKVTAALKAMASDPSSPVVMEKKGNSYQYDWSPR